MFNINEQVIIMNKPGFFINRLLNNKQLLEQCVAHLNQLPDIEVDWGLSETTDYSDGWLLLHSTLVQAKYFYILQPMMTMAMVNPIIERIHYLKQTQSCRPLLISFYLTQKIIEQLIAAKCEFLDATGNMYFNNLMTYILIKGQRPTTKPSTKSILTIASLKLIYVLLTVPNALEKSYRELAQMAGISLGSVSSIIQDLHNTGYLEHQRHGHALISNPQKLLYLWEVGYTQQLRPKLFLDRFTMFKIPSFTEMVQVIKQQAEAHQYLIGGELGAALMTNYLRPGQVTLHVTEQYRELIVSLRLKPDPNGPITFLRQFGTVDLQTSNYLANPLLIRAELLINNNARLHEVAALLLDQYLKGEKINAF